MAVRPPSLQLITICLPLFGNSIDTSSGEGMCLLAIEVALSFFHCLDLSPEKLSRLLGKVKARYLPIFYYASQ
jgi:hypothetical protein